ncbi:hypothetical protein P4S73_02300 [Paraglaciecola sp. Hal342]
MANLSWQKSSPNVNLTNRLLNLTTMPYCRQYLKAYDSEHLVSTVRLLAKQQFQARDAYPLDNPSHYNIDNSMNDVRAITDTDNQSIRIFCRYENDVERMSQRINNFAESHSDICGVFDEGEKAPESITFNIS